MQSSDNLMIAPYVGRHVNNVNCSVLRSPREWLLDLQRINPFIGQSDQEPLALDGAVVRKISKRRFFQDIIKSFQGATQLGLKLPQFFSFQKISTNTVARSVQILGRYGPQQAGWLSNGQNFCIILAQSWDKEMLKISRRYLNWFLNNH